MADGGDVISRATDPSGTCGLQISRERLLLLPGHRRSITSEERNSSSVNILLSVGKISGKGT